jgi:2-keto-4-pentenoate hydratase/2-oxohepta-3-ene-1,7-dioic acid hydratase in catechol pathway
MRLVSFSVGGPVRVGVTNGTHVADLATRMAKAPADMISLIESWDSVAVKIRAIDSFDYPLEKVHLHAPIARPGKIYALGLNYAEHLAEGGVERPKHQSWFTKPATAVNGPYDPIERPIASTQLDYEAELVYVIGKRCKHVGERQALEAIFGYCVGNDVSIRDWQLQTSQYVMGKSFDTHAPYGPWIVTADCIDASDLAIKAFVNGQQRQSSRTSHMIFGCAAQVAHLSRAMTLEPGDVIFTGTPAGVGAAMKPPVWLKPGDKVRIEIEDIGALENEVIDERTLV